MLLARALESERVYFALGAQEHSGTGWRFLAMPGLPSLPAASVSYLETEHLSEAELTRAVAHIEAAFSDFRASFARIYTRETEPAFVAQMARKGYRCRTEIIHAFEPLPAADATNATQWREVRSERDWADKSAIHALPSGASDGYEAAPDQWVALERLKSETGKLSFHIFSRGDQPIVTTGLIRLPGNVVRIKNFFVRSDQRRRGMGKMAVGHMLQFLAATGEKAAVVLSVEGSIGQRLYNACGARDIGRIYEWSRPL